MSSLTLMVIVFNTFWICYLLTRGDDIAVIQFDQGSFHKAKAFDIPDNIIPIFQPPHSPELNPIERFWEFSLVPHQSHVQKSPSSGRNPRLSVARANRADEPDTRLPH